MKIRHPRWVLWTVGACLMTSVWAGAAPPTAKTTAVAIEGSLTCQCGCQQTVSGCNHEGCGSKAEMQGMAEKEVASGKDSATILQDFVLRYGTQVRATPPPNGFNLMVWILPIVGGILGLTLVVVLVRRWRQTPPVASAEPGTVDPQTLAEVEEEMKHLG
jgi:cytochrome c-type biogenesis protein CcmH/NrfF